MLESSHGNSWEVGVNMPVPAAQLYQPQHRRDRQHESPIQLRPQLSVFVVCRSVPTPLLFKSPLLSNIHSERPLKTPFREVSWRSLKVLFSQISIPRDLFQPQLNALAVIAERRLEPGAAGSPGKHCSPRSVQACMLWHVHVARQRNRGRQGSESFK